MDNISEARISELENLLKEAYELLDEIGCEAYLASTREAADLRKRIEEALKK